MTQRLTDMQYLADIRERSKEAWRIHDMPPVDPETGVPKPFRVISKADEDVKFLLRKLDEANDEIARLEDMVDDPLGDADLDPQRFLNGTVLK
jgi:hypothetical protein